MPGLFSKQAFVIGKTVFSCCHKYYVTYVSKEMFCCLKTTKSWALFLTCTAYLYVDMEASCKSCVLISWFSSQYVFPKCLNWFKAKHQFDELLPNLKRVKLENPCCLIEAFIVKDVHAFYTVYFSKHDGNKWKNLPEWMNELNVISVKWCITNAMFWCSACT